METFGSDYVVHNLPLIVLSGLYSDEKLEHESATQRRAVLDEGGFRIRTNLPPLGGPTATYLLNAFRDHDGSNGPWKPQSSSPREANLFKVRSVGRTYTLPARKAPPPPHSPRLSSIDRDGNAPQQYILHSPLSPLTPSSSLYPNGIMTPLWIAKHQSRLPSAFVTFFALTADTNTSSLQDNQIESEINDIRGVLATTNYKTKLLVVLLAEGDIDASDVEERVATIRRSTALDQKSLYFVPASSSQVEIIEFTRTMLSSLHPVCIEYYRELSKHARRKRNRGTIPQPTIQPTNAHILPQQGWIVRYEFKLGVFAEFRQEMDAACRNYETAYEYLFSSEMIDSIASWSPRFNEGRLLADVIALRTIRCLLWTGQSTSAVRMWINHRNKIRDFLDRRSNGSQNYGWEAWQCTWAKTMATLISRSEIPSLKPKKAASSIHIPIFAEVEKALPVGERTEPWEQLHHEGYWLEMAQNHTQARRAWAHRMPEEDRQPPGRSPASLIASKANLYDTYLALEPYAELPVDNTPGFDYVSEIVSCLSDAAEHFAARAQLRMEEILQLRMVSELLQARNFAQAGTILGPLWQSPTWRKSGWWELLQRVGEALLQCAYENHDLETAVRVTWELGGAVFTANPSFEGDLQQLAHRCSEDDTSFAIALDASSTVSRLASSFAFVSREAHVGEPVECQFVLRSSSLSNCGPTRITEVKIVFEGGLKPIRFLASQEEQVDMSAVVIEDIALQESSSPSISESKRTSIGAIASLTADAGLTIAPGQVRVFGFQIVPREAGDVSIASTTLVVEGPKFNLTLTVPREDQYDHEWWELRGGSFVARRISPYRDASQIEILPKPPKLEVQLKNFQRVYYTNENITLDLEVVNAENEPVAASVYVRLVSPEPQAIKFGWADEPMTENTEAATQLAQIVPVRDLGDMQAGQISSLSLLLTSTQLAVDHELEIVVKYKLESDKDNILTKALVTDITVVRPFESNYEILPRLGKDDWPNFFEPPAEAATTSSALGLKQEYQVNANLVSFAVEPICIEAIVLTATKITGGATCISSTGVLKQEAQADQGSSDEKISTHINPEQTKIFTFDLSVQKLILGDRHSTMVDLALEIGWRRLGSQQVNTSVLEVPQLVSSPAEPRVMLTMDPRPQLASFAVESYGISFWIENPSMHFLTFNITMDSSESFAFSGPKATSISLVPISRCQVKYRILPNKATKKEWIKVQLNVVDAYFGQTLRVQPASDGVKADKKGNILVYLD